MTRLSNVNEKQAVKLMSEVDYGKHLQGSKITAMTGGIPVLIMSLQEVKEFLYVGDPESLSLKGGGGRINYLDLNELKIWTAEVFGDQELANAIDEEIEKGSSYVERIQPIKQLIEERLAQCKALLECNKS